MAVPSASAGSMSDPDVTDESAESPLLHPSMDLLAGWVDAASGTTFDVTIQLAGRVPLDAAVGHTASFCLRTFSCFTATLERDPASPWFAAIAWDDGFSTSPCPSAALVDAAVTDTLSTHTITWTIDVAGLSTCSSHVVPFGAGDIVTCLTARSWHTVNGFGVSGGSVTAPPPVPVTIMVSDVMPNGEGCASDPVAL